jgi:hypothetical protein
MWTRKKLLVNEDLILSLLDRRPFLIILLDISKQLLVNERVFKYIIDEQKVIRLRRQ